MDIVKYKNEMNLVPMKNFNAVELDLFFSICSRLKEQGREEVKFTFDELKHLSDYKPTATKRFVEDLNKVIKKLQNLEYTEHNKEKTISRSFNLFIGREINEIEQYAIIFINSRLEYILNRISNEFTQFELREFTELTSSYSKGLYRLLKQFKTTGFYTVKIESFRELLDIPDSYKMGNIDQQVLNPAIKELGPIFNNLSIKKVKAKKGNLIDRLEFTFDKQLIEEKPSGRVPLYNWLEGYQ